MWFIGKSLRDREAFKKALLEQINSTKYELLIYAGELSSHVYNDKDVISSIRNAYERNVFIKIICGPSIDVGNVELLKMAKEGYISLYKKPERAEYHYRVSDGTRVFLEGPHKPLQRENRVGRYYSRTLALGDLRRKHFYSQIESGKVQKVEPSRIGEQFKFIKYDEERNRAVPATEADIKMLISQLSE
jgi:hypothetical protein